MILSCLEHGKWLCVLLNRSVNTGKTPSVPRVYHPFPYDICFQTGHKLRYTPLYRCLIQPTGTVVLWMGTAISGDKTPYNLDGEHMWNHLVSWVLVYGWPRKKHLSALHRWAECSVLRDVAGTDERCFCDYTLKLCASVWVYICAVLPSLHLAKVDWLLFLQMSNVFLHEVYEGVEGIRIIDKKKTNFCKSTRSRKHTQNIQFYVVLWAL